MGGKVATNVKVYSTIWGHIQNFHYKYKSISIILINKKVFQCVSTFYHPVQLYLKYSTVQEVNLTSCTVFVNKAQDFSIIFYKNQNWFKRSLNFNVILSSEYYQCVWSSFYSKYIFKINCRQNINKFYFNRLIIF